MFLDGIIGFAFRNLDVSRVDTRLFCIVYLGLDLLLCYRCRSKNKLILLKI